MKNRLITIIFVAVVAILISGVAFADSPYDSVFTIPEYNLVCVSKGQALSCTCPCGAMETMPVVVTATIVDNISRATPTEIGRVSATPTDIGRVPATATPTVTTVDGVRIVHYDAKGNVVWDKCMPVSAWNGHESHAGHIIQDLNLGNCSR